MAVYSNSAAISAGLDSSQPQPPHGADAQVDEARDLLLRLPAAERERLIKNLANGQLETGTEIHGDGFGAQANNADGSTGTGARSTILDTMPPICGATNGIPGSGVPPAGARSPGTRKAPRLHHHQSLCFDPNELTERSGDQKIITVDCGGVIYRTFLCTLRRHKYTRLWYLTNDNCRLPQTGFMFLDRNPVIFGAILNYYRCDRLAMPPGVTFEEWNEELLFYHITPPEDRPPSEAEIENDKRANVCCYILLSNFLHCRYYPYSSCYIIWYPE
jgi:hypothetical protein